jgi:hypothetical protein
MFLRYADFFTPSYAVGYSLAPLRGCELPVGLERRHAQERHVSDAHGLFRDVRASEHPPRPTDCVARYLCPEGAARE